MCVRMQKYTPHLRAPFPQVTPLNAIGIAMTLLGSTLYSMEKYISPLFSRTASTQGSGSGAGEFNGDGQGRRVLEQEMAERKKWLR